MEHRSSARAPRVSVGTAPKTQERAATLRVFPNRRHRQRARDPQRLHHEPDRRLRLSGRLLPDGAGVGLHPGAFGGDDAVRRRAREHGVRGRGPGAGLRGGRAAGDGGERGRLLAGLLGRGGRRQAADRPIRQVRPGAPPRGRPRARLVRAPRGAGGVRLPAPAGDPDLHLAPCRRREDAVLALHRSTRSSGASRGRSRSRGWGTPSARTGRRSRMSSSPWRGASPRVVVAVGVWWVARRYRKVRAAYAEVDRAAEERAAKEGYERAPGA